MKKNVKKYFLEYIEDILSSALGEMEDLQPLSAKSHKNSHQRPTKDLPKICGQHFLTYFINRNNVYY